MMGALGFADTIKFCFLAALISLDQVACFQMLLSRPIFTALILGSVFGDLGEAVLVGVCFELLFVRSIPIKERAAADPTLATAATLGGMWGATLSEPNLHSFIVGPFAAGLSLLAAFLSKWFDVRLRGVNVSLSHRLHRPGSVQATAVAVLFAKSFGFYLLTVLAVQGTIPKMVHLLGPAIHMSGALAWGVLVCICLAFVGTTIIQNVPAAAMWALGILMGTALVFFARSFHKGLGLVVAGIYAALGLMVGVEAFLYMRRKERREASSNA